MTFPNCAFHTRIMDLDTVLLTFWQMFLTYALSKLQEIAFELYLFVVGFSINGIRKNSYADDYETSEIKEEFENIGIYGISGIDNHNF